MENTETESPTVRMRRKAARLAAEWSERGHDGLTARVQQLQDYGYDGYAPDGDVADPQDGDTTRAATTVTMTETDRPSRSKGRGWARIDGYDESFATETGRKIDLAAGETITVVIGCELRRRTRTEKLRQRHDLTVTGDVEDIVSLSLGSPQSYDVSVSGVRRT